MLIPKLKKAYDFQMLTELLSYLPDWVSHENMYMLCSWVVDIIVIVSIIYALLHRSTWEERRDERAGW